MDLPESSTQQRRKNQLLHEISVEDCDLNKLRALIWHGSETKMRATIWKIILGYCSTNLSRRESTLERKRIEYSHYRTQIYEARSEHQTEKHLQDMKQIDDDIPRTQSNIPIFKYSAIKEILRRVLYIWAIRHPSSGYVQGINDLCSVFLLVFLAPYCDFDVLNEAGTLPEELDLIEADCYWCLSIVVDSILDYFFQSSSGIQKALIKIKDILSRIDQVLVEHFETEQIEMIHFSFRWLNCMFIRELPMYLVFRLWDGFLSLADGFRVLSLYVAASLILKYKEKLKESHFNEVIIFLQNLPSENWTNREIEELLSQAYIYYSWFSSSPSHLSR